LTLVAFRELKDAIAVHGGDRDRGIQTFCYQNEGDGWMLPETLRLDDLGLGHDERAKHPQPVRERLGERFLPSQLDRSIEESWAECERHARNILGENGFGQLLPEIDAQVCTPATVPNGREVAEAPPHYQPSGGQGSLFGDPDRSPGRR
jgi:hypothetical protein